jgi:VanZ family protein
LILAFLLVASWELNSGRLNARHLTFAWIAVAVWAAIDELTQIPVGRVADFWDWLADVAGAAAGILLFVAVRQFIERRNASG